MGWLFAGVKLVVRVEPHDVEHIANEKAVYTPVLIARYGELIRRIALELLVKVSKAIRLGGSFPLDTVRFESRISICRKLKRRQTRYVFKALEYFAKVSGRLSCETKLSVRGVNVLERKAKC